MITFCRLPDVLSKLSRALFHIIGGERSEPAALGDCAALRERERGGKHSPPGRTQEESGRGGLLR